MINLDRAARAGLAFGLAAYVMPFWREGRLRWAFGVTLMSTLLHVYTSNKSSRLASADAERGRS
ncbi:MAG: hypothetical protein M3O50_03360 [Myxococcota bacterium]|nr:hypothetical protein [Myxococcota bacterium]